MTGNILLQGRKQKGWEQEYAAEKLGISQPYLSLLERGERPVSESLQRKAARLYDLSAVALPITIRLEEVSAVNDEDKFASELGALGYPGFAYLRGGRKRNPVELLASALCTANLDIRLVEALPWLVYQFSDLNWDWLIAAVKVNDRQNRLGYVVHLAKEIAQWDGQPDIAALLAQREQALERSRLAFEDTLCDESVTEVEKKWVRQHRPEAARRWGVLTDLRLEHLHYVNYKSS